MSDEKTFVVRSNHNGTKETIEGKSFQDALKKSGLNPSIWIRYTEPEPPPVEPDGDS